MVRINPGDDRKREWCAKRTLALNHTATFVLTFTPGIPFEQVSHANLGIALNHAKAKGNQLTMVWRSQSCLRQDLQLFSTRPWLNQMLATLGVPAEQCTKGRELFDRMHDLLHKKGRR
jgi:hypothetical protein